jgi:hypothetical protein
VKWRWSLRQPPRSRRPPVAHSRQARGRPTTSLIRLRPALRRRAGVQRSAAGSRAANRPCLRCSQRARDKPGTRPPPPSVGQTHATAPRAALSGPDRAIQAANRAGCAPQATVATATASITAAITGPPVSQLALL